MASVGLPDVVFSQTEEGYIDIYTLGEVVVTGERVVAESVGTTREVKVLAHRLALRDGQNDNSAACGCGLGHKHDRRGIGSALGPAITRQLKAHRLIP